jgi:NADPH:quinone reductase-like Zn-dependent oxidoreductase
MKAIVVADKAAGMAGMTLVERPEPEPAINDVVVEVHASGFVPTELTWPSTWVDRAGRDRTPSVPGHELAGVVYVIGTGRAGDRQKALDFGAMEFVDLGNDALEDAGAVDLVFDVIGGNIQQRSAGVIRAGGTLVSVVGPAEARPADGLAVDFVVESDRAQLGEVVQRVRDGRLRTCSRARNRGVRGWIACTGARQTTGPRPSELAVRNATARSAKTDLSSERTGRVRSGLDFSQICGHLRTGSRNACGARRGF